MTLRFRARAVLTDIEGTTGSIAFVRDVLFPYADTHLDDFLASHAHDSAVQDLLSEAAREAGLDPSDRVSIARRLHEWIARDAKATSLKALEGMIWQRGYAAGELRGHVYDDAVRGLRRWHSAGLAIYVYSSGSIAAQKLIFGHSMAGDLTPLFSGYFDTTTGPKQSAASYERIAREIGIPPADTAFLSDSAAELDAAKDVGMQTLQLIRQTDGTVGSRMHPAAATFDQIQIEAQEKAPSVRGAFPR